MERVAESLFGWSEEAERGDKACSRGSQYKHLVITISLYSRLNGLPIATHLPSMREQFDYYTFYTRRFVLFFPARVCLSHDVASSLPLLVSIIHYALAPRQHRRLLLGQPAH